MEKREKGAIRLTNKTAMALRRTAKKVQKSYLLLAVLATVLLAGVAVAAGMRWLPAVPIAAAAAVLVDVLLVERGRRCYLEMVGAAICTEAAARAMRGEKNETQRRRQAVTDMMELQLDVHRAMKARQEEAEDDDLYGTAPVHHSAPRPSYDLPQETKCVAPQSAPPVHRRRRPALSVIEGETRIRP